jgi:hypothetical protein
MARSPLERLRHQVEVTADPVLSGCSRNFTISSQRPGYRARRDSSIVVPLSHHRNRHSETLQYDNSFRTPLDVTILETPSSRFPMDETQRAPLCATEAGRMNACHQPA